MKLLEYWKAITGAIGGLAMVVGLLWSLFALADELKDTSELAKNDASRNTLD